MAPRQKKEDYTRNGGQWSDARFHSFIISNIRRNSWKWGPISRVEKAARTRRGFYLCAHCEKEVPATIKIDGVRKKNVYVDHIEPIVDPAVGFTTYDDFINRLFCEEDGLQVLCKRCHDKKTADEKAIAIARRKSE